MHSLFVNRGYRRSGWGWQAFVLLPMSDAPRSFADALPPWPAGHQASSIWEIRSPPVLLQSRSGVVRVLFFRQPDWLRSPRCGCAAAQASLCGIRRRPSSCAAGPRRMPGARRRSPAARPRPSMSGDQRNRIVFWGHGRITMVAVDRHRMRQRPTRVVQHRDDRVPDAVEDEVRRAAA